MAVKIRLQRHGRKRRAYYHIVVADSRSKRDGKYLEKLGFYNPNTNPATIEINMEKSIARVTKSMSKNPRRIGKIIVDIDIPYELSTKEKRLLNQAAMACPVHHSLHPDIKKEINITFTA